MKTLSFCIPVYNNARAALELVRELLGSQDEHFEVIVCDDASPDNTEELLSGIHDGRFRYVRNPENLGFRMNWLKSLELAEGEYLYFVIGRDRLHGESITRLIELLERAHSQNISCLKDNWSLKRDIRVYGGMRAMMRFTDYGHPTGIIFRREAFRSVHGRGKYYRTSDIYPENWLMRDILLSWPGAVIRSGVYRGEILIDESERKSAVDGGTKNILDAYYAPRRRTGQFFEMIDMIDGLGDKFGTFGRGIYFHDKFYTLLQAVSTWWKRSCENPVWQSHYGQEVRQVTTREMMRNILAAHREVRRHLRENGRYSILRELLMSLAIIRKTASILLHGRKKYPPS